MVARRGYVPDRGDIVRLAFDPQAGREQAGRRPALVLSPRAYNAKTSLAICCPITSRVKDYPFEVMLPEGLRIAGAVLADHVKSLDWKERQAAFECKAPTSVTEEVLAKLNLLLDPGQGAA